RSSPRSSPSCSACGPPSPAAAWTGPSSSSPCSGWPLPASSSPSASCSCWRSDWPGSMRPAMSRSWRTRPAGAGPSPALSAGARAIGGVSAVTQQSRGATADELQRDYVRTRRSRGLPAASVVFKPALRSASGPALAVLNVQFVGMLGGAVIVEQVFQMPGLGQLAVGATTQGDVPLVMGLVVATGIIVVLVNLLIDIAQGIINPKVRLA